MDRSGSLRAANFLSVPITTHAVAIFQISWGYNSWMRDLCKHLRWNGLGLVDNTVAEFVSVVEWHVTLLGHRTPSCLDFIAAHKFTFFHSVRVGSFFTLWMQGQPISEVALLLVAWVLCDGFFRADSMRRMANFRGLDRCLKGANMQLILASAISCSSPAFACRPFSVPFEVERTVSSVPCDDINDLIFAAFYA